MLMTILVVLTFFSGNTGDSYAQSTMIPHWVKNDVLWLHNGEISDSEFTNEIKWLVEHRIIPVQYFKAEIILVPQTTYLKNISYQWYQNKVSDIEFIHTVEYMIRNGVIQLDKEFASKIETERYAQVNVTSDEKKSVVIIPVFTSLAYSENGFYDYFNGRCNKSCLSKTMYFQKPLEYTSSQNALQTLKSLGYDTITDIDVDKDPEILSKYDKIIILHNEYVTQKEFYAITHHSHVIYLYPNALYASIEADYKDNTINLIRGHGYPSSDIRNGFDWKYDNSSFEYDTECNNWNFVTIDNGIMLNCYPENHFAQSFTILKAIKDY